MVINSMEKMAGKGKGGVKRKRSFIFNELVRGGLLEQMELKQSPESEKAACQYLREECPRKRKQPAQRF